MMKKFKELMKELMRKPVTFGDFLVFCIVFSGITWFWANEPDPVEYAKVIKEKAKKSDKYIKLDDLPDDGEEEPIFVEE